MLTKLRIKNFKCLRDTGDLDIRPLTFLVGPNSSGKSTVLQMLLMLRQTVDSTDIDNPLATNDGWVQMGAYPEFIYRGGERRLLEVSFEMTEFVRAIKARKRRRRIPFKLSLRAVFSYSARTTQITLKEREITLTGGLRERVVRERGGKEYWASLSHVGKGKRRESRVKNVVPIKFYDLRVASEMAREPHRAPRPPAAPERPWSLAAMVEREFRKLFYLGPLREFPKRVYITSGQAPQDVGTRGERAVDVLWFSHRSPSKTIRRIEEETRRWLRQFSMAVDIRLDRVSTGNYYRAVITDPATGVETNLADIGFGASQTLPIIVESFYAPPGSVILIEQPEIHLHPKAQSTLGDLFITAAADGDRTFIIETHSEHILARVRRRIAEKQIEREKVVIYYFQPTSDGIRIREVTLNKYGQYKSFPDGFFEEDVLEAFEHLKAIKGAGSE